MCAFIIIGGGGYIGIKSAGRLDVRIAQLRELITGLRALDIEISMNNSVLPDAMRTAGEAGGGACEKIFSGCADELEAASGETVHSIWCRCIDSCVGGLRLAADEIKTIKEFGVSLGSGDRTAESGNIRAAVVRLERAKDEAMKAKTKNAALYRGLGFAAGILITVLLL